MKKRRTTLLLVGLISASLAIGGYYRYWRYNLKRFDVVQPGVLYRSGQPSLHGLDYLVRTCGVRTVLCIRSEEPRLKEGLLFDVGRPLRITESAAAERLGARFLLWPVSGDQLYWPWPQPDQFDALFRLFDDPENLPVTVHCLQGRHRTGTCVALFRLEYDRWDVQRTLDEMYCYDFGPAVRLQEHNLRTYFPRPRPDAPQWSSLRRAFGRLLPGPPPVTYEELIRRLRKLGDSDRRYAAVTRYLETSGPLAICLANRLIDNAGDRLVPAATEQARRCLASERCSFADWATSAAILADYGSPAQQSYVLELLHRHITRQTPTPLYQALVAGLTNRYTPNRIPYLLPLLSDNRFRPEPQASKYRYADTAAARLASITNDPCFGNGSAMDRAVWDDAIQDARRWFEKHPKRLPGLQTTLSPIAQPFTEKHR